MVNRLSRVVFETARPQFSDLAVHAAAVVGLFWLTFVVGEYTTGLVALTVWVYIVLLYGYKVTHLDTSAGSRFPRRFLVRWVILFPLIVFCLNLLGMGLLSLALENPVVRTFPVVEQLATGWTVWDASGLSAFVVYTSLFCLIAGTVSVIIRPFVSGVGIDG